jgi:hypothetical protein
VIAAWATGADSGRGGWHGSACGLGILRKA